MKQDNRTEERFDNIGRVEAFDICALPGVLDDISLTGCRVHFPIPVSMNMGDDYTLKVKLSRREGMNSLDINTLEMIATPQWKKTEGDETAVGFKFLRSPSTPDLAHYIGGLKEDSANDSDISNLIVDSQVNFIG